MSIKILESDDLYNVDKNGIGILKKIEKFKMRIASDLLKFCINFIIGGLILNHIVSVLRIIFKKVKE